MRVRRSKRFKKDYQDLPSHIQQRVDEKLINAATFKRSNVPTFQPSNEKSFQPSTVHRPPQLEKSPN